MCHVYEPKRARVPVAALVPAQGLWDVTNWFHDKNKITWPSIHVRRRNARMITGETVKRTRAIKKYEVIGSPPVRATFYFHVNAFLGKKENITRNQRTSDSPNLYPGHVVLRQTFWPVLCEQALYSSWTVRSCFLALRSLLFPVVKQKWHIKAGCCRTVHRASSTDVCSTWQFDLVQFWGNFKNVSPPATPWQNFRGCKELTDWWWVRYASACVASPRRRR